MVKSPKPPPPPDPYATSAADQAGHVGTAIAQTALNNADEESPFGTVDYEITGNQTVKDAQGKDIDVPTYTRKITLSEAEQQKYDLENQVALQAGDIATNQLDLLNDTLSSPINYDDLPEVETDQGYYQDLLFQRLNPEIERDRERLETQLANQGIAQGTEAYKTAQEQMERNVNDARIGGLLQAGQYASQEQQRQLSLRQQLIQEKAAKRSIPINEISALMGQNQVNMPQFQGYNPGTIQPTSVGDNINREYEQRLQAWQIQQQSKNSALGGLFGLGSSLIGLF